MINVKFRTVAISSYIYIILPIIIFFLTWLKWYVGISATILLIVGFIIVLKKDYINKVSEINLPINHLIGVAMVILIWTWLSGQGGFFFQTWDNHSRNAIFRDMINFDWPIVYPQTGNALVYYLLHWIVPALFGKLTGWLGGNIALLAWTYIGLMLVYLLILYLTKANSSNKMWLICIIFIFWSGLNHIGLTITDILGMMQFNGLGSAEGWLDFSRYGFNYSYLYRNNLDFLSQVYNQTIVPWIAVPLMLENKKVRNFAFIGLIVLPYAPIPFIGFLPIFLVLALQDYVKWLKKREVRHLFIETFSIPNITAIITIFIIFLLYFKCNVAGANGSNIGLYVPVEAFGKFRILMLILFDLLEFGIMALFIFPNYKKDKVFWTIIFTLILIPLFKIGTGRDFCMNACLVPLFILMIMVINFMIKNYEKQSIRKILLIVALTIAALSPLEDVASRLNIIKDTKQFPIVADNTKTLSNMNLGDYNPDTFEENYIVPNPEDTFFFKYIAKNK